MAETDAKAKAQQLAAHAVELISPEELEEKLAAGKPLRVKFGMDPTAPDLHLGHTVALKKLAEFQRMGHKVVFLVGDFTALIGDPTGRSETRRPLGPAEVRANAKTYLAQVSRLLDVGRTEVRFNSEWMDRLSMGRLIEIAARLSVARLIERDDFEQRLQAGQPLFLHELIYPLIQGYDSVELKADVELGGSDQKFNMLVGRELQRAFGQSPQVVITMPLLEGLDGVRKMSKSYGNYVGLTDPPEEMFGKLMSIPDRVLGRYLRLLAGAEAAEIEAVESRQVHPMEAKKRLAWSVTCEYHGKEGAELGQRYFEEKFQHRVVPADAPVFRVEGELWICELMKQLRFVASNSEARRLIGQGAVRVDGRTISDPNFHFVPGRDGVLEVGKRRVARVEAASGAARRGGPR